jgi:hypothetical protein
MLNCVNSLEPQSMNSGIERAALMISEEKTQHDSRKLFLIIQTKRKCNQNCQITSFSPLILAGKVV